MTITTQKELRQESRAERVILALDNSQIASYLTCPRKWYFEYLQNIEPRTRDKWALDNGTIIHNMLDTYYRSRAMGHRFSDSLQITFEALKLAEREGKLPDLENSRKKITSKERLAFLTKRFGEYCTNYVSNDYVPLVIDGQPQVEVGFTIPLIDNLDMLIVLEGRIDLITTMNMFVDHKSQERESYIYNYDTQFLTYATALDVSLGGINYFGLQETLTPKSFRRETINFSSEQRERWKNKLADIAWEMKDYIKEMDSYKSYNDWDYNPLSCSGPFRTNPCMYHKICEQPNPTVGQAKIKMDYQTKSKWEPWVLAPLEPQPERP